VDFDFSAKGGSPAADQNAFPTRGSMQDQTKTKKDDQQQSRSASLLTVRQDGLLQHTGK
jgi:hypothetical protein